MANRKKQTSRRTSRRRHFLAPVRSNPEIDFLVKLADNFDKKIPKMLRERLCAAGFSGVSVTHGRELGFYEAIMEPGTNQRCATTTEAFEFFTGFKEEMGGNFAESTIGCLVQDNKIRAAFILLL